MSLNPVPSPDAHKTRQKKTSGLRHWMLRALEECDNVSVGFDPDAVHDLRVSLRRCRSLADGLMALDPYPGWQAMKKAAKALFQRLGDLRDTHVMEEWVEKLQKDVAQSSQSASPQPNPNPTSLPTGSTPDESDPASEALLKILSTREAEQKREVQAALEEFDRKQWRQWAKTLPARAAHIRPGSALFKHLALERWTQARELHNRALRNRSQTALHTLRIGIKRFRYIVENFLPAEHIAWSGDLKEMQDLLGEVHDLDVLWSTAVSCHVFPDATSRSLWHQRILAGRAKRIDRYRAKMVGPNSLWQVWREKLPRGKQIQQLATRRMKLWANGLDPDFPHSERVASLALQIYDGLLASAWQPAVDGASARSSLLAAALLHDVGKSKGEKGHHKASLMLIRKHGNPLGWNQADLQRAAIVARFHRGSLPTRRHKTLRDLLPGEQRAAIQLAAILRLANALDTTHDGHIRRIKIENGARRNGQAGPSNRNPRKNGFLRKPVRFASSEALVITAEGYSPLASSAQTIAAERHLLETVLRKPVVIKPMKPAGTF